MAQVSWPGRFQLLKNGAIADGGHNPDGVTALCNGLKEFFPNRKFNFIFSSFEDKDTASCLKLLLPLAKKFSFMPLADSHRPSCSGEKLKNMVQQIQPDFTAIETFDSLAQYLAKNQGVGEGDVICGSLYLLGEYFQQTSFAELKNI